MSLTSRDVALDTPSLVIDLDRMEANIRRWQATMDVAGVALRPHVKTHKSPEIAQMQLAAGAVGITVAKVAEAEVFAAHGCRDIFIAFPVIGAEKWRRAAALARDCRLTVGVDSALGARGLSAAAIAAGVTLRVRVEVDTGLQRAGLPVQEVGALCRQLLELPGLELDGLFTFRSTGFAAAGKRTAEEIGAEEGSVMVELARDLRAASIPIHSVSVGSTPTARAAARVPGVTEVRPGTYIFGDYMQTGGGYIGEDEVALSILCTVVSRPAPDLATIDGGSKTFSGDVLPERLGLRGYARVVGMDAYLERMSEEHGVVRLGPGINLHIGDRIALHPIHVCTTVNLSDELIGLRNGQIERIFPVLARGKRT
ncbi:MAG: alanine racemase [Herpetosiphonaceae bacterium]|nr:alanine racemase [Herpetosiphonaceae bacterium]